MMPCLPAPSLRAGVPGRAPRHIPAVVRARSLRTMVRVVRQLHRLQIESDRARTRVKRIKCASAQFFLRSVHICCTLFLAYVLYGAAGWLQHPPSAVPVPKAASLLRLLSTTRTRVPCARSGVVGRRVTAASWQAHAGGLRRRTLPTRADAGSAATSTTTCSSASIPAWISPTARASFDGQIQVSIPGPGQNQVPNGEFTKM